MLLHDTGSGDQSDKSHSNPKVLAYSPQDFSSITGISVASLYRDRTTGCLGGIPFKQVGTRVLYPVDAIRQWLQSGLQRGGLSDLPKVVSGQMRGRGRPKGTTKSNLTKRRANTLAPPEILTVNKDCGFSGVLDD